MTAPGVTGAPVDVFAVIDSKIREAEQDGKTTAVELRATRAAVAELIGKMEQIERLSRTADPKLVDVPAMLGDIARAALARVGGAG